MRTVKSTVSGSKSVKSQSVTAVVGTLLCVSVLFPGGCSAQESLSAPTYRSGTISWAACDTSFVDPYFPHVCRTGNDANGKVLQPSPMRIAVTVHAAWSISRTSSSTMITSAQSAASATAFEQNGAPTRLKLARLQDQKKFQRLIGYRRGIGEGSTIVEDESLCQIGDDVGSAACDANFYGFMIDRLSADKQLFHARYTFEITLPESNDFEIFFEGCCRITDIDNNPNMPFYLSTTVQMRQSDIAERGPPRSSAQFAHPETVMLRRNGDYFENDGPDANTCTRTLQGTLSQPTKSLFQIQAYHTDDAYATQLRYRLGTINEMGNYKCRDSLDQCTGQVTTGSSIFTAPPYLEIDPLTGETSMRTGVESSGGPSYDGPGHGTWTVTVIVETLQCTDAMSIAHCPNPVPYIATLEFLLNVRETDTPLAFDASQPRPYYNFLNSHSATLASTVPATTRLNPIRTRCGIAAELSHFDFTDPDTGKITSIKQQMTFGFYDPDHNSCVRGVGDNSEVLEQQHIAQIWQAHAFPEGVQLLDQSDTGSYVGKMQIKWTPRCEETSQLGIKMLCFTARDGRSSSGFEFLISKPSPVLTAPSCLFLNVLSPLKGGKIVNPAPYLVNPTAYTTCSADCCVCCGSAGCACESTATLQGRCCFTIFARSGTLFALTVRAKGDDSDIGIGLDFFFPDSTDGIHSTVETAGLPTPVSHANKYGCAAYIHMVVVLPITKRDFDTTDMKAHFMSAVYDTIRDMEGDDPLPAFQQTSLKFVADQKDLSVARTEIDIDVAAGSLALSMGMSSFMVHSKILARFTRENLDRRLSALDLEPIADVLTPATIDDYSKQRVRATPEAVTVVDAEMEYEECVSNDTPSDMFALNGGSPNHVTSQLTWDISAQTGSSCRAKDTLRWIPCRLETAPQFCASTSPCERGVVEPIKVCYQAKQLVPAHTNRDLFKTIYGAPPDNSTCAVCFALRIASRPFFIEKLQVGAEVGSTHPSQMQALSVNKTLTIELVAADNLGERTYIYLEKNPGAPSGAFMTDSELVKYNGQQYQGNAYRRIFRFTPSVTQVGDVSTVCFVAQNGEAMQSTKRCYVLDVRAAAVQWTSKMLSNDSDNDDDVPAPGVVGEGPDVLKVATVGCQLRFNIVASAPLYSVELKMQRRPTCSTCIVDDSGMTGLSLVTCSPANSTSGSEAAACCGNDVCDGAEMGSTCPEDCGPDDMSLKQTQMGLSSNSYMSVAILRWRPTRGMEGRTLLMCVLARAAEQGDYGSIIQQRTALNAPTLCYAMKVERCSFCVEHGSNIKSIAETLLFHQHWLRLYNSNPTLLRPDRIPSAQRLAVGPLYTVMSGDTILAIAGMAKTTVKAILVNNPDIFDERSLVPEALLCLPLCSAPQI